MVQHQTPGPFFWRPGISMQGRVWVYLSAGQRMQQAYIYVIMYTFVCKYVNDLHVDDIIVYKIPLIIHPCVYMQYIIECVILISCAYCCPIWGFYHSNIETLALYIFVPSLINSTFVYTRLRFVFTREKYINIAKLFCQTCMQQSYQIAKGNYRH